MWENEAFNGIAFWCFLSRGCWQAIGQLPQVHTSIELGLYLSPSDGNIPYRAEIQFQAIFSIFIAC